jgi:hypothetical protein
MILAYGIVADSSEIEPRLAHHILLGHCSVKSFLAFIEPGRATAFSAEALSQNTIFGRKNLKCHGARPLAQRGKTASACRFSISHRGDVDNVIAPIASLAAEPSAANVPKWASQRVARVHQRLLKIFAHPPAPQDHHPLSSECHGNSSASDARRSNLMAGVPERLFPIAFWSFMGWLRSGRSRSGGPGSIEGRSNSFVPWDLRHPG